ncbi:fibronectin type III domain-containing protein [Actinoplanes sp. TRM88002]|uniref:Fibronectin type III domain-containing protein n=2 Tax=Paractinoplanes hotanensis TaxID=2906497 RepID=A0ABT0Y503_9ACTN|nr:fibronectin type III domain-containing protein [Actinoplanes hotanensis]
MILTWDAAPPNGSDITAYEVTWTAADGATGATTTGGQARTVAIGGLVRERPYRIGVLARTAGGVGVPAVVEAALPSRWITVHRGADTTYEDKCGPPDCAYPYIELFGFPPRTEIQITPVASAWGRFNVGAELTTNDQGYLRSRTRFPFSGVGQTLWVDVGDTQSNRFLWPEKGP